MSILTKYRLRKIGNYYYRTGKKNCFPLTRELKNKLLETYGTEPFSYTWTEQDIHQESRNIFFKYFSNKQNSQ